MHETTCFEIFQGTRQNTYRLFLPWHHSQHDALQHHKHGALLLQVQTLCLRKECDVAQNIKKRKEDSVKCMFKKNCFEYS